MNITVLKSADEMPTVGSLDAGSVVEVRFTTGDETRLAMIIDWPAPETVIPVVDLKTGAHLTLPDNRPVVRVFEHMEIR